MAPQEGPSYLPPSSFTPHIGDGASSALPTPSGVSHNYDGNLPPPPLSRTPSVSRQLPLGTASPAYCAASPAYTTNPTVYIPPIIFSRRSEELSSPSRLLAPLSPPMIPQDNSNYMEHPPNTPDFDVANFLRSPSVTPSPLGTPNDYGEVLSPQRGTSLTPTSPPRKKRRQGP